MKKEDNLTPTRRFKSFSEITPEFLYSEGIKGLLCDIDDTFVPHNYPFPTKEVLEWAKSLADAGIRICLISNNKYKRVRPFAKELSCPFFTTANKPSTKVLYKALAVLNMEKSEVAFLGDQVYTDIKCGNRFGIPTYKVEPVGNNAPIWVKIKRKREGKIKNG